MPVTIRLLDPPLHEFLPHNEKDQAELAKSLGKSLEQVKNRVDQLHESNPMLGHRGDRLAVTYPEILEMQVRAIIEAACECARSRRSAFAGDHDSAGRHGEGTGLSQEVHRGRRPMP
jgi:pyruvate,orthophosphate dikinase